MNEQLINNLIALVLLAFVIERGLSVVFEHSLYIKWLEPKKIKEFIAVGVSYSICYFNKFDILQSLLNKEGYTILGIILTSMCIAGGSKVAIRLFQDVLGVKKSITDTDNKPSIKL